MSIHGKDLLLAIDNGTQSLKAIIFDPDGRLLAKQVTPIDPPYFSKRPGWAQQDPDVSSSNRSSRH